MALRVVGAGAGRTGTLSLKAALEQLLGGPCYHMIEVLTRPDHVPQWCRAATEDIDWSAFMEPYVATVDFPACLFWEELSRHNPEAVVVLSTRRDTTTWWESASQTIFTIAGPESLPAEMAEWYEMWVAVATARFTDRWTDEKAACEAYERHNARVRAEVPPDRLVEWQPGDGWKPLCDALGVAVPHVPFPHLNTRQEFPTLGDTVSVEEAVETLRGGGGEGPSGG